MCWKKMTLALCAGSLAGVVFSSSCANATGVRPAMQTVVACVYNIVKSKSGVLSIDVYTVGTYKYVIEYKFRSSGTLFTGGIGIHDGPMEDGNYFYTNDTPSGQPDNYGGVELDFLGEQTIYEMYGKCHLMPGFDDTIRVQGTPEPQWQKIDMPEPPT